MRTFHGDALILDVFDLHEKDRIVTLLTRERGKMRGVARGARTKYSRFAGQLQPLARVRVRWFEKEGRDLVRISEVELERPARRLQEELEGILLGSYLAEHLTELVQEDEPGDLWFRLLDSTVEALLEGVDRDVAARYFEAWALRLSGIFPAPRECPVCERTFSGEGAVLPAREEFLVCADCGAEMGGGLEVAADVLEFLERIGHERLVRIARQPPESDTLRRAERLAAEVRRRFLGRELKSYGVIRQMLPTLRNGAE